MTDKKELTYQSYLLVALPFMLSTATQPLLGAVDTAVIGMVGDAAAIAGVSLGATLFNTLYWIFGFLRVSTTSRSAQVQGKPSGIERNRSLLLPLLMAVIISLFFLLLQMPILSVYLSMIAVEVQVMEYVRSYYRILIWGAPVVLANYVILGWLMGQARVRESLFMQISGNVVNMVLDYWLAIKLGQGITGVAAATLVSQIYSTLCGIIFLYRSEWFSGSSLRGIWNRSEIRLLLQENRDLMLRTICLLIHNNVFVMMGARLGTEMLAANAILLQLTSVQAYLFEGMANAASVFAGVAKGNSLPGLLKAVIRKTAHCSMVLALMIMMVTLTAGQHIIRLFTKEEALIWCTEKYLPFACLYPLVAVFGLTYYGIYTGSGVTRPVFLSTVFALLAFLPVCFFGVPALGNIGLWLAYLTFYGGRSIGLVGYRKRLLTAVTQP
ncbi:MAG: MATE family efflux transporter [Lachnospiraceae bacterium]